MADKNPQEMTIGELRKAAVAKGMSKEDALKTQKEDLVKYLSPAEAPAAEEDDTDWDAEPAAEGATEEAPATEDGNEEVGDDGLEPEQTETEEGGEGESGVEAEQTEAPAAEEEKPAVADFRGDYPKFEGEKRQKANEFRKKWAAAGFERDKVPAIAKELGFGKAEAGPIMGDFCDTCGTQAPAEVANYQKVGQLKRCVLCHNEAQSAANTADAKGKGKAAKGEGKPKKEKVAREGVAPRKKQAGAEGTAFSYHGGEDGYRTTRNTRNFAHQTLSGQHVTDAEAKALLQAAHPRFTAHYAWCSLRDLQDLGLATQERKDSKQAFKVSKYDGPKVEYVPPANPLNAGRPAKEEKEAAGASA